MSFDSTCRRLAEQFPEDFATWLMGRPIEFTVLDPTELSLEPIRADSLILLQGDEEILHIEFQTDPTADMPMRLADYRLRLYRKFPNRIIHQVVIYLRYTTSDRVHQEYFEIAGMYAEFRVIRIWEVPLEELLQYRGLLPFAALGKSDDPEKALRQSVRQMKLISDESEQHETIGAAYVLSGLILGVGIISRIIRRDVMRESVTYQAILEEGREEAREEARATEQQNQINMIINLLRDGVAIEIIARATGRSIEDLTKLRENQGL
jgi:predicted transposase/invertase (TIGR01784 family)